MRKNEMFLKLLKNLVRKRIPVSPDVVMSAGMSEGDFNQLQMLGVSRGEVEEGLAQALAVNYERMTLYREVDRSLHHWAMGAAVKLFGDYATTYNSLQDSTIWVTSDAKEYNIKINQFLNNIGIEEKIYDWACSLAGYGDLFVKVIGEPGVGVICIDDSYHPASTSRLDFKGALVGFFDTPFESGLGGEANASGKADICPPWDWVHFRILGARKRRSIFNDNSYSEYRSAWLTGPGVQQMSTKYGVSLLNDGLPIYKKLKLAEDSLLLARVSRSVERYLYKIKVGGSARAASEIIQEYKNLMKRTIALNIGDSDPKFDSKFSPLTVLEDIFVPVFGDTGDITKETLGGNADVRWIVDIEDMRNQLACALNVPLSLLGGWVKDATGALGSEALGKLDLRFGRSTRRVQRALIQGITRLVQIHLAYMNMDPDPNLFTLHMGETSVAEEQELRDSLEKGVDVIDKFMDTVAGIEEKKFDKVGIFNYFVEKILKLSDFNLESYVIGDTPLLPESIGAIKDRLVKELKEQQDKGKSKRRLVFNTDCYAAVPLKEKSTTGLFESADEWSGKFKGKKIEIVEVKRVASKSEVKK